MKIKPLQDRILVKRFEEVAKTKGGINNITPVQSCGVSVHVGVDWSKTWNESDRDHQDVENVHNVVVVLHSMSQPSAFGYIVMTQNVHER